MEKIGSIDKSVILAVAELWNSKKILEKTQQYSNYLEAASKSLASLKILGKSQDIDLIIQTEQGLLKLEKSIHHEHDKGANSSLDSALNDFADILECLSVVKNPDMYKEAAKSHLTKRKINNVPVDAFHQAINGHITRLGNRINSVGIPIPEKNDARQRQANMRTAKELYISLQRTALGLPPLSKSKGLER